MIAFVAESKAERKSRRKAGDPRNGTLYRNAYTVTASDMGSMCGTFTSTVTILGRSVNVAIPIGDIDWSIPAGRLVVEL